jgi:hypothetical protein
MYPDGLVLRLSDIARLEPGRPIWTADAFSRGPAAVLAIFAAPRDHQL